MDKNKINHIGWIRIIVMVIPYFIVLVLFQGFGYWVSGLDLESTDQIKTTQQLTIVSFFGLLGTLFIVWVFMKIFEKEKFINLGFQTKNRAKEFSVGIFLGAVVMILGYSVFIVLGQIQFVEINFNGTELILSVVLFISVAVTEEVLLRGYILKNLMVTFNKYIALIVSAILFSLMHAFNPNIDWLSMLNLFLAGILLGLSYVHTRNLWFPIALHLSWNLFQALLGFNVSGKKIYSIVNFELTENNVLNGGDFGFEGSIFCLVLQVILIFGIARYYGNKKAMINEKKEYFV